MQIGWSSETFNGQDHSSDALGRIRRYVSNEQIKESTTNEIQPVTVIGESHIAAPLSRLLFDSLHPAQMAIHAIPPNVRPTNVQRKATSISASVISCNDNNANVHVKHRTEMHSE